MKIQIKELHMLQPHVWLNDEVLNCYGGLIMRRSEQHFDFLKGSTAWGFRS
jgi:Ulp1 family protease